MLLSIIFSVVMALLFLAGLGLFLLLSQPEQSGRRKASPGQELPTTESTQWLNQLVVQWFAAVVLSGGSGDAAVVSDRLCYLVGRALAPSTAVPSSSSSSHPNPNTTVLSASSTSRFPLRRESIPSSRDSASNSSRPRFTRDGMGLGMGPGTPLRAGIPGTVRPMTAADRLHSPAAQSTSRRPQLKGLRLSNGPEGIVKVPVIGAITSEVMINPFIASPTSTDGLPRGKNASPPSTPAATVEMNGPSSPEQPYGYRFQVPLSFDDLGLFAEFDYDIPLLHGLGQYHIPADLATLKADIELRTLRLELTLVVEVIPSTGSLFVALLSDPRWETKITSRFGTKHQSIAGGAKVEEIARLAVNRVFRSMVYPHGLLYRIGSNLSTTQSSDVAAAAKGGNQPVSGMAGTGPQGKIHHPPGTPTNSSPATTSVKAPTSAGYWRKV